MSSLAGPGRLRGLQQSVGVNEGVLPLLFATTLHRLCGPRPRTAVHLVSRVRASSAHRGLGLLTTHRSTMKMTQQRGEVRSAGAGDDFEASWYDEVLLTRVGWLFCTDGEMVWLDVLTR